MGRCLGRACAGVLILAAAGCTLDSFLSPRMVGFCVYGPKQIVPGTVSEVSAKLLDGLNAAAVILPPKRVGSEYRIAGVWKKYLAFCLHLSQQSEPGGIKTLVRMKWDRGGDEELWQLILQILNAPDSEDEDDSKPSGQPLTAARRAP